MKPSNGKYQTATRVKVLSPEIFDIREDDSFHLLQDSDVLLYYVVEMIMKTQIMFE